jgi:hypothetical protein
VETILLSINAITLMVIIGKFGLLKKADECATEHRLTKLEESVNMLTDKIGSMQFDVSDIKNRLFK